MNNYSKQGKLFQDDPIKVTAENFGLEINMSSRLIESWQLKLHDFQSSLFKESLKETQQSSFFEEVNSSPNDNFNPLELSPLALNFWKWPKPPHNGPSIYLVMDKLEKLNSHIILYIGETLAAERRWKGEHDCKSYIEAYTEALSSAGLRSQLSIRFWKDVPKETKPRRNLEQFLIQKWLPPFNKETRNRWQTPFTS